MPQFSVDSRTIDNVIGYINNGQISIPEIQRPFVWKSTKIRDLIDSLYNGFPVGYLIVWQNPSMKDKQGNDFEFRGCEALWPHHLRAPTDKALNG